MKKITKISKKDLFVAIVVIDAMILCTTGAADDLFDVVLRMLMRIG